MTIDTTVLQGALKKWGTNAQVKMMREECIELALEISKFTDRDGSDKRFQKVIDEIADVTIMAKQMELVPGWYDLIQARVDFKMERLKDRLIKNKF